MLRNRLFGTSFAAPFDAQDKQGKRGKRADGSGSRGKEARMVSDKHAEV